MPYDLPPPRMRRPGDDAPPVTPPPGLPSDHRCSLCEGDTPGLNLTPRRMLLWAAGVALLLGTMLCSGPLNPDRVRTQDWLNQHCTQAHSGAGTRCYACDDGVLHCVTN